MAGRGPAPKPDAARQRRNKAATRAELPPTPSPAPAGTPQLPDRRCSCRANETSDRVKAKGRRKRRCQTCRGSGIEPWHERTLAFWADLWSSPMVAEFAQSDVHALFILATLVDRFWWAPDLDVAKEVRLQLEKFGLTPLARRSLQWKLPKGDGDAGGGGGGVAARAEEREPRRPAEDPRKVLRMVARGGA